MRKVVITLSLIGSILIILDSFNVGHAMTLFVLAGIIPGTNAALGSSEMLMMYTLLIGFVLSRFWLFLCQKVTRFIHSQKA